ncbi:serine/threonine-protein kinase TAO3-like [Vidua macroura]|uniref:serine/threonine-protein kinase TAO3-like n=1 Tax=Vidua macroura TaxID=187451 RepID=UPI0023A9064A|nr:serine/threonine-protein kinase TAO3-like [Vidua macroura]
MSALSCPIDPACPIDLSYRSTLPHSALYHIAQRDPPALKHPQEWSEEFRDFVSRCLRKLPQERPRARELLQHAFLAQQRPPGVVPELLRRTKMAAREEDPPSPSPSVPSSPSSSSDPPSPGDPEDDAEGGEGPPGTPPQVPERPRAERSGKIPKFPELLWAPLWGGGAPKFPIF